MFPIQSVRLINLNIPDENYDIAMKNDEYHFESLDSLITLANGGGKSSLILLLSQVFKPNARRGKRQLKDYVPEEGYSVISVELNQGQQYTTLNLVARKKFLTSLEGDTKEALEYFLFISEYGESNRLLHCPHGLPFFKDIRNKVQTPYEELEKLVQKKPEYFRHYKQNESKKYMSYLESRFHNVAAWADTIWQINSVEGGASGLFAGSKDNPDVLISSQAVIRDHLIPIIESKNQIDEEEIRKQLTSIGQSYASQYDNQVKRERLNKVREQLNVEFIEKTENASTLTANLNQATSNYENALAPLNSLREYHEQQIEVLTCKELDLKKQLSETSILKQMNKVSQLTEEIEDLKAEVSERRILIHELKEKQKQIREAIKIQEATQKFEEYVATKDAVRLKQEAIEVKKLNNTEKSLKITEIQQTLATVAHQKFEKAESDLTTVEQSMKEIEKELTKRREKRMSTYGEIEKQKEKQRGLSKQLKEVNQTIDDKWATLPFETKDLSRNQQALIDEQDELEHYYETCQDEVGKQQKSKEEAESTLKDIVSEYDKLEGSISAQEKAIAKVKENRQFHLVQLSSLLGHAFPFDTSDKDIQIHINEKLAQCKRENNALTKEINLIEQSLKAKRGVIVPDELEKWLQDNEIGYVQGIDYLSEKQSKEVQAKLIEDYPMLPYSLVLSHGEDLERIKACPVKLSNDLLLTFMKDPDHYLGQPEVTWWGVGNYKVEALNPAFWEERRQQLETQKAEKNMQLEQLSEEVSRLHGVRSVLEGDYSLKTIEKAESELDHLFLTESQLSNKKSFQELIVGEATELLKEWKQKELFTNDRLDEIAKHLDILSLISEYVSKQQDLEQQSKEVDLKLAQKNEELEIYSKIIAEDESTCNFLELQCKELSQVYYGARTFYSKYEAYLPEVPLVVEDILNLEELEKHLSQLQSEVDLTQLEEELATLNKALVKAFKVFKECGVEESICANITYNSITLKHFKDTLNNLINELVDANGRLSASETILNDRLPKLSEEKKILQEELKTHRKTYEDYHPEKTITDSELKETEKFLRNTLNQTETQLGATKESHSQLVSAVKSQSKQKYIDLSHLRHQFTETQLAQMEVSEFLTHLDQMQEQYEHHRNHLEDALREWRVALRKAWNISQDYLNALPTGLRKQKESLIEIDLNNYLTVIEIHQVMIERLEDAIKNEEDKLKEADKQLQSFSEYLSIQCQEVYDQLKLFDRGLNIELNGKNEEILKLDVPLICLPEQFETSIQDYVRMFVMDLSHLMQIEMTAQGTEIAEAKRVVENKIKNFKLGTLLAEVIDFEHTALKVLKVSNLNHKLILWESDNSGGQGSLKALILIFTIFKYLNNDKNGTTILLDNPFGKMSSHDLVNIMFKTAERLRIKLICFTGIEEQHIQQKFKVHYKLSHVPSKTKGLAIMRVEREGEIRETNRFERGYYAKERIPSVETIQESLSL